MIREKKIDFFKLKPQVAVLREDVIKFIRKELGIKSVKEPKETKTKIDDVFKTFT